MESQTRRKAIISLSAHIAESVDSLTFSYYSHFSGIFPCSVSAANESFA